MRDFEGLVRLAKSKHVFAVFDSCFAGTIFKAGRGNPPPAITRKTALPVRQFLTSGDATQTVPDDGRFRKLFLRALRGETERAYANGDGYLTASEIGLFLEDRVTNLTRGRLTPRYGKLLDEDWDLGDFVFALARAAAPATSPPAPSGGTSAEVAFWQSIKDSDDADSFQAYLDQFPNGTFAALARLKLKKLRKSKVAVVAPPKPVPPPAAGTAVGVFPKTFKDCAECPEMVVVPAGSFRMGDLSGDGVSREKPVHGVTIRGRFAKGKYEVTFAEWDACVATGDCYHRPVDGGWGRGASGR